MRILAVSAACAAALALSGCGNTQESSQTHDGATGEEAPLPSILGIAPLGDTQWLVADVGIREETRGFSKGAKVLTHDIWLIDRQTGNTTSLLPDRQGVIDASYFAPAAAGPLASDREYLRIAEGRSSIDAPLEPAFYVLRIAGPERSSSLFAGAMSDKKTRKLAGPFMDIHHMEMLDPTRLLALVDAGDEDRRLVFDLATMATVENTALAPAAE